jgi:hypothetical protein
MGGVSDISAWGEAKPPLTFPSDVTGVGNGDRCSKFPDSAPKFLRLMVGRTKHSSTRFQPAHSSVLLHPQIPAVG